MTLPLVELIAVLACTLFTGRRSTSPLSSIRHGFSRLTSRAVQARDDITYENQRADHHHHDASDLDKVLLRPAHCGTPQQHGPCAAPRTAASILLQSARLIETKGGGRAPLEEAHDRG